MFFWKAYYYALSSSPSGSATHPLTNEITSIWCLLERFSRMLLPVDLGFDRGTLIFFKLGTFHIWLDRNMCLLKASWATYSFSQNYDQNCKISDALVFFNFFYIIFWSVALKLMPLCVWNFSWRYPRMSYFQPRKLEKNGFHQLGLMRSFPRWLISILFIISNLYGLRCVTVSPSRS